MSRLGAVMGTFYGLSRAVQSIMYRLRDSKDINNRNKQSRDIIKLILLKTLYVLIKLTEESLLEPEDS